MKTTTYIAAQRVTMILVIFLGFQIQFLMAKSPASNVPAKSTIEISAFVPFIPKEATFNDIVPEKEQAMVSLAPRSPKEATFEEVVNPIGINPTSLKNLAPVTPKEADFKDSSPVPENKINTLEFRAPFEAYFIDF